MNERIKELLIQSEVFNKDGTVLKDVCGYELNKFAQLIVRECADIAYDTQYNHGRASYETDSCARAIRQHFGVGVIHLPSVAITV